jgi:hypothetical protein
MPDKTISIIWPETGETLYAVIYRISDGAYFDDSTNTFTTGAVTTINLNLTAEATVNRLYQVTEPSVWSNENHIIMIFKMLGGSAAVATDTLIACGKLLVVADTGAIVLEAPSTEGIWNNDARTITSIANVATGIIIDKNVDITEDDQIIRVWQANNKSVTISLGTNWPLTGKLVNVVGKNALSDSDASAVFDISATITDATNGIATFTLTTTHTATATTAGSPLYCEVEVSDDPGGGDPETAKYFRLEIREKVYD